MLKKKDILSLLLVQVVLFAMERFYQLKLIFSIAVALGGVLFFFLIKRQWMKKTEYEKDFQEAADYMEQMLFVFEREERILPCLAQVKELFEAGKMKELMEDALVFLQESDAIEGKRLALESIEEEYGSPLMGQIHQFMLEMESIGGDGKMTLALLQEEEQQWRLQVQKFVLKCKKQRNQGLLAIVTGSVLGGMLVYFAPDGKVLTENGIYQIGSTVILLCNLFLGFMILKKTVQNYLVPNNIYTEEQLEKKMRRYLTGQSRLGRHTLKRILSEELLLEYPKWMMNMGLLLQSRNVYGAMEESMEHAGVVLKPFIQDFLNEVRRYPDNPAPFMEFLGEFKTTPIHTSMKILYSISTGNCKNLQGQIMQLVRLNQSLWVEKEEKMREKTLGGMYVLFLAPTFVTSMKLILDMSVLLLSFIAQLGMA